MDAITEPTEAHRDIAAQFVGAYLPTDTSGEAYEALSAMLAEAEARGRLRIGGNAPPPDLVPEKLIDPDALPALFEANYWRLMERRSELEAGMERWKVLHLVPRPDDWPEGKAWPERYAIPPKDEADFNKTSDMLRVVASFAGGKSPASGEVNEARERVKKPILDAGKVTDNWFNLLREPLRAAILVMDRAQADFLVEKREVEQRRRDSEAAAALEEANRLAEAARVSGGDETVVERAVQAEAEAAAAVQAAEAPITDMTRTKSAAGSVTSLVEKWTFRVVDIVALCRAVVDNKVPAMFVKADDAVIGPMVRKKGGLRECPGLAIEAETTTHRTGRTA